MTAPTVRAALFADAARRRDQVIALTRRLVAIPSPNPPGDTGPIAEAVAAMLAEIAPGASVRLFRASREVVNLVAVVAGNGPGRRIILNGHLDTYPVNEALPWTVDPLSGTLRDDRIWGRGAADMKGGIAASMTAFAVLAAHAAHWPGEVALTLAGDEETMGVLGTKWLLDNVEQARGDAAIIGDAGSPRVLRFGEKGFIWLEIEAQGRPSHGAHVHLGINALDRLLPALDAVRALRTLRPEAPDSVTAAIAAAKPVSEPLCGEGEAETLGSVTVNFGRIEGGTSLNLVPAFAKAAADVRLPAGLPVAKAEAELRRALDARAGIAWKILRKVEPTWTEPDVQIVQLAVAAARDVLGTPPVTNMRVGASDARLFRACGIPTVVYGPTPFNMGGADEHVLVEELDAVAQVHALTAFDFLTAGVPFGRIRK